MSLRPSAVAVGRIRESINKQAPGHELRTMGYRKLSVRPHHRGQRLKEIAAREGTTSLSVHGVRQSSGKHRARGSIYDRE